MNIFQRDPTTCRLKCRCLGNFHPCWPLVCAQNLCFVCLSILFFFLSQLLRNSLAVKVYVPPSRSQLHWIYAHKMNSPNLLNNELFKWETLLSFSRVTNFTSTIWKQSLGMFLCVQLVLSTTSPWVFGMWGLLLSEETTGLFYYNIKKNVSKGHCHNEQYKVLACVLVIVLSVLYPHAWEQRSILGTQLVGKKWIDGVNQQISRLKNRQ